MKSGFPLHHVVIQVRTMKDDLSDLKNTHFCKYQRKYKTRKARLYYMKMKPPRGRNYLRWLFLCLYEIEQNQRVKERDSEKHTEKAVFCAWRGYFALDDKLCTFSRATP